MVTLIEAAKAVIADRNRLGAMFEWEGNDVLTSPNALRWQAIVAVLAALWVFQIVGVLVAWRKHGR